MEIHWVHIKEASCLMLKGLISLAPPVKNRSARMALARSVGWKGSQNKWSDRFLHRLDAGVHANKPLKGPSPQHPMFVMLKPAHVHKIIWQSFSDRLLISYALENAESKYTNQLIEPNILDLKPIMKYEMITFFYARFWTHHTHCRNAHEYGRSLKWLGLQGHKVSQLIHVIVILIGSKP